MPIEYSVEFKRKVIQRYEKGESIKNLSQELHIAQSTIYHWRKLFCSIRTPQHTYTPNEFDAMARQLKSWSIIWKSSINPAISPVYHYRKSLPLWRNYITDRIIRTAFMSFVMRWGCKRNLLQPHLP